MFEAVSMLQVQPTYARTYVLWACLVGRRERVIFCLPRCVLVANLWVLCIYLYLVSLLTEKT